MQGGTCAISARGSWAQQYTFPVVVDHEQVATAAYNVCGFPTVYLVDKTGTIRYMNVGVTEGIETILSDQIESLLD